MKKFIALTLSVVMILTLFCACGAGTKTVGILIPNQEQTLWTIHGERLAAGFEEAGYTTMIEYAGDDTALQAAQIEDMISKDADVLIIAAVDGGALADACAKAKEAGILIIADDRLIRNTDAVDFYVASDRFSMGQLQGQYIIDALDLENQAGPFTLEIFSGPQDDPDAVKFYDGAMSKLQPYMDEGKLTVRSGQTDHTATASAWDAAAAQTRMDSLLSGNYLDGRLDAVLAADDTLASGVIASLESMGFGAEGLPFPVITGQGAETAAVESIASGKQGMTVIPDTDRLVEVIVPLVDDLLADKDVTPDTTSNNGAADVPTKQYGACVISADNVAELTAAANG